MYMAVPFLGKGIGKPHRFSDGRPFALGSMREQERGNHISKCAGLVSEGKALPDGRFCHDTARNAYHAFRRVSPFAALGKSNTPVSCAVKNIAALYVMREPQWLSFPWDGVD